MRHALLAPVRLRAVLFDYGGTLDGEASHWLDRFVGFYQAAGIEASFDRIEDAFYAADDACYADAHIADVGLRELIDFHVQFQLQRLGLTSPPLQQALVDRFVASSSASLASSRRVLARLHPAFRLGVVSNFYGNVERILHDADFGPLLTVVADSHRVRVSKPDPAIYTWAVERLGVHPGDVLHIGDSYERDVVAARAAGLRTAWLVGDKTASPPGPSPDLTLRSLDELLAYLDLF